MALGERMWECFIDFYAVLSTIFSLLTLTLNYYSAMVSSLAPKWKTHPNPVMTQHIRDRSRKPSTPQVRDGAGTLASPPLMLKHKTSANDLRWDLCYVGTSKLICEADRRTGSCVMRFLPKVCSEQTIILHLCGSG